MEDEGDIEEIGGVGACAGVESRGDHRGAE